MTLVKDFTVFDILATLKNKTFKRDLKIVRITAHMFLFEMVKKCFLFRNGPLVLSIESWTHFLNENQFFFKLEKFVLLTDIQEKKM